MEGTDLENTCQLKNFLDSEITEDQIEHVRKIAKNMAKQMPQNISLLDLIASGFIGLLDAISKFDPSKKANLKTFSEIKIRYAIMDYLRSIDCIPRSTRKKAKKINGVFNNLEQELGRPANDEEKAKKLGLDEEEFHELINETAEPLLLNLDYYGDDGDNEGENYQLAVVDKMKSSEELLHRKTIFKTIMEVISILPEKEQSVILLYYYDDLTMKQVGGILGYTESRVSQIHSKAMIRLRKLMKKRGLHADNTLGLL